MLCVPLSLITTFCSPQPSRLTGGQGSWVRGVGWHLALVRGLVLISPFEPPSDVMEEGVVGRFGRAPFPSLCYPGLPPCWA